MRRVQIASILGIVAVTAVVIASCTPTASTRFTVSLENVSTAPAQATELLDVTPRILVDGQDITSPLSPAVWVVHTGANPLFTSGQAASDALEALAEDGDPSLLVPALQTAAGVKSVGLVNTPEGSSAAGPIGPGGRYQFSFNAVAGDRLSVATMFVQSNDLFYAPGANGIQLFGESGPVLGDVTSQLQLWDAGTEVNQRPGVGEDQAPRQAGPNTGTAEGGTVGLVNDAYTYPDTADQIQLSVLSAGAS
jgi:hypothetical protein